MINTTQREYKLVLDKFLIKQKDSMICLHIGKKVGLYSVDDLEHVDLDLKI